MMNKALQGPYAVLMTPFAGDKPDEAGYVEQVKRINASGISGFVVNGSTAEFVSLSLDRQKRMAELVAKNKSEDKELIVSACTADLVDTLDVAAYGADVGAKAVLVCPPYYFKYTTKEREAYYRALADKSPLPVILYNIPFFTQEMELDLVFKLFLHENVIGIKDSSANMKRLMHMVDVAKDSEVSVLTGTDDILYPAIFAGVDGSMTALAAVYPDEIARFYRAMSQKDYGKAKEIQDGFMQTLREADSQSFPKGYKKLMEKVSGIKFKNKGE